MTVTASGLQPGPSAGSGMIAGAASAYPPDSGTVPDSDSRWHLAIIMMPVPQAHCQADSEPPRLATAVPVAHAGPTLRPGLGASA